MAKDLAEMERDFVATLAADTGRDLGGWMAAITASGEGNRNDIIDWLRQQGFAFPRASWLERIHHNGGRLIYAEERPAPVRPGAARASPALLAERGGLEVRGGENSDTHPGSASPPPRPIVPPIGEAKIMELLAVAKGLKPLAELVLREVGDAITGVRHTVTPPYLIIESPEPFAALLPAPKEIRLFADFGPEAKDRARKAEALRAGAPPPFPDVLVLNDARQVDARFRDLVAGAYRRSLK